MYFSRSPNEGTAITDSFLLLAFQKSQKEGLHKVEIIFQDCELIVPKPIAIFEVVVFCLPDLT